MPDAVDTIVAPTEKTYEFFFYGTLCVPAVLIRVLGHSCADLTFQDAILYGYTRHRVKDDSYPAIIDKGRAEQLLARDQSINSGDFNTRGTYVQGLSYSDVHALDLFEGEEYSRIRLPIQTLSPPSSISSLPKELSDPTDRNGLDDPRGPSPSPGVQKKRNGAEELQGDCDGKISSNAEAWAFVWSDSLERLMPEIWGFEEFIYAKQTDWRNIPSEWYDDVDNGRGDAKGQGGQGQNEVEDGDEGKVQGKYMEGYETFGKTMLKYWGFKDGYVNLNHGSYGSPPLPIISQMHELSTIIEQSPDHFLRREWLPRLNKTRGTLAKMIGAQEEEVVLVPNTTHGIFNILSEMKWEEGDVLVVYSTTYGAISQTAKYLADRYPLKVHIIPLVFPLAHSKIVSETEKALSLYNNLARPNYTGQSRPEGKTPDERVRMVIVDVLASNPGVLYPWQEIVTLCKKYGVLSMVDGAHAVGQVPLDLKKADCDFFVSNCHKWLMSHRGGALLYVATRNQYMIRTSIPTSAGYESLKHPTPAPGRDWAWASQYNWTGTCDWGPAFSILPAIEFRKSLGGEERIMTYCQTLAIQGGKTVLKKWKTRIMETPKQELTVAMVNVALPHIPFQEDLSDRAKQLQYLEDGMFEGNCFAACYVHGGMWWARFCGQVWNELDDFEYVADVLEKICLEIKEGKHLKDQDAKEAEAEAGNLPAHDE